MINQPRRVTCNSANAIGRPGQDRSVRMVESTPRNGTRVLLRGIRVNGTRRTTDVVGYVANVKGGTAYIETWGVIKRQILMPVTALTFYKGK